MEKKTALKPISAAIGATFMVSMAAIPIANAADNPFGFSELSGGYLVAEAAGGKSKCAEGKSAEGKCSGKASGTEGKKAAEGKCAEGKCAEGKCSGKAKQGDAK